MRQTAEGNKSKGLVFDLESGGEVLDQKRDESEGCVEVVPADLVVRRVESDLHRTDLGRLLQQLDLEQLVDRREVTEDIDARELDLLLFRTFVDRLCFLEHSLLELAEEGQESAKVTLDLLCFGRALLRLRELFQQGGSKHLQVLVELLLFDGAFGDSLFCCLDVVFEGGVESNRVLALLGRVFLISGDFERVLELRAPFFEGEAVLVETVETEVAAGKVLAVLELEPGANTLVELVDLLELGFAVVGEDW